MATPVATEPLLGYHPCSIGPVSYTHLDVYKRQDHTWINFYDQDGSLVAENQTNIQDPGYPMDVTLADNGVVMMVAYQYVDNGETTSYVAFYNFVEVGQSEDDRIVSGYTYVGTVIPQIQYLGNTAVAVRDDGFTLYTGRPVSYTHLDVYKRQAWHRP